MKKIIVKDCMQCPLVGTCKAFKSLSASARFAMKTCPSCAGILKTCPLEDDNQCLLYVDPVKNCQALKDHEYEAATGGPAKPQSTDK